MCDRSNDFLIETATPLQTAALFIALLSPILSKFWKQKLMENLPLIVLVTFWHIIWSSNKPGSAEQFRSVPVLGGRGRVACWLAEQPSDSPTW